MHMRKKELHGVDWVESNTADESWLMGWINVVKSKFPWLIFFPSLQNYDHNVARICTHANLAAKPLIKHNKRRYDQKFTCIFEILDFKSNIQCIRLANNPIDFQQIFSLMIDELLSHSKNP